MPACEQRLRDAHFKISNFGETGGTITKSLDVCLEELPVANHHPYGAPALLFEIAQMAFVS